MGPEADAAAFEVVMEAGELGLDDAVLDPQLEIAKPQLEEGLLVQVLPGVDARVQGSRPCGRAREVDPRVSRHCPPSLENFSRFCQIGDPLSPRRRSTIHRQPRFLL